MHPGVAISFGNLSGQDYWRLRAGVEHLEFTLEPTVEDNRVKWVVRNRYLHQNGTDTVCFEESACQLNWNGEGLVLEIDSRFFNDDEPLYFGDQEESGLCVRMHPALAVNGGAGTITNNRGELNEAGTWGREFEWLDYSGILADRRAGILIVPHPQNPRASWAHSRDYGIVVANPFPRPPGERAEPFVKTVVHPRDRFRLRYSILIYETAAD
jgi:hypothetical protein